MRATAAWFLTLVFSADVGAGAFLLAQGGVKTVAPKKAATPAASDAAVPKAASVAAPPDRLDQRTAELDEMVRGFEVLKRAGFLFDGGPEPRAGDAGGPVSPAAKVKPDPADPFVRLQKAYEAMEPEAAAKALSELTRRDRTLVVRLLLGWKARTSGAILEALTKDEPKLAAELSAAMAGDGGTELPEEAADSDR